MDIGAAFVADGEPTEAVEPGDRPFDDPPAYTQSAAMRRAAARQNRRDPAGPEAIAMGLRVVTAVSLQRARLLPGAAAAPADRGQGLDQRIKLGDVVDVRRGYLRHERDATGIRDEMVFGARLAAIGWVRSSFFPPRTARTDPLSITVQRWSSRPRRRNSASNVSWSRCQTPMRCQWTKRRQHVLPDPHPICFGNICQGIPDRRTNRMPVRIARSGIGVRPCRWPRWRRRFGISGSSRAQIASSTRA
jgi:hypothetical protein